MSTYCAHSHISRIEPGRARVTDEMTTESPTTYMPEGSPWRKTWSAIGNFTLAVTTVVAGTIFFLEAPERSVAPTDYQNEHFQPEYPGVNLHDTNMDTPGMEPLVKVDPYGQSR